MASRSTLIPRCAISAHSVVATDVLCAVALRARFGVRRGDWVIRSLSAMTTVPSSWPPSVDPVARHALQASGREGTLKPARSYQPQCRTFYLFLCRELRTSVHATSDIDTHVLRFRGEKLADVVN